MACLRDLEELESVGRRSFGQMSYDERAKYNALHREITNEIRQANEAEEARRALCSPTPNPRPVRRKSVFGIIGTEAFAVTIAAYLITYSIGTAIVALVITIGLFCIPKVGKILAYVFSLFYGVCTFLLLYESFGISSIGAGVVVFAVTAWLHKKVLN